MDIESPLVENNSREQESTAEASSKTKKFFVKTYGCQMNVYDSERIEDTLSQSGYEQAKQIEDADLVLVNTCHIREKAAEKIYSEIGRMNKLKKKHAKNGRSLTLGITGCVAQAEGKEIMRRAPVVDLIAGPQTYHNIADMVEQAIDGKKVISTEFEIEEKFAKLLNPTKAQTFARGVAAYLTIQEGCDKFCTFCVVPYTRGGEVSRPINQVIDEAKRLVDAGVREVTLLGQNVNAWHGEHDGRSWTLGDLLHELALIDGIERLRYTTSHPIDMDHGLIEAHRDIPKLMPYLHLPVQAGSNRIIKAMNRHHTREQYIDIIEAVRKVRPDIAISGDFIVGFPGETDADFEQTIELVETINYSSAFSFKYSPRPGTPGADMENQVDGKVQSERLTRLQALLQKQQIAFNQNCVGKDIELLVEKHGRDKGQLIGRSPWLQSVVIKGKPSEIGQLVNVHVTKSGLMSMQADRN